MVKSSGVSLRNIDTLCTFCLVFLLAIPIVIFQLDGIEVPLSYVAIVVSPPFYFLVPNIREKAYVTIAALLSLVSIFLLSLSDATVNSRPLWSLGYFFSPYVVFFAGYRLIKRYEDMRFVLILFAWLFIFVSVVVTLSVLQSGQGVRVERFMQLNGEPVLGSALSGSFLGLTLYATWGVNSLAVFYTTMFATLFISVFYCGPTSPWFKVASGGGLLCLLYLVVGSFSREAVLGLVMFLVLSLVRLLKISHKKFFWLNLGILVLIVLLGLIWAYGSTLISLFTQSNGAVFVTRSLTALSERRFDDLSSGRLSLLEIAISEWLRNPLWGTGFHGFQLSANVGTNSSPHNQYVTAIWKMGVLPGFFYLLFLYRSIQNLRWLKRRANHSQMYAGLWILMLVYVVVFCMLWDVLLVPIIGAFVMFLLGGVTRIYYAHRRTLELNGGEAHHHRLVPDR